MKATLLFGAVLACVASVCASSGLPDKTKFSNRTVDRVRVQVLCEPDVGMLTVRVDYSATITHNIRALH